MWITKKREKMERKVTTKEEKREAIARLEADPDHDFLAFFVCRNPVAQMLSVFGHHKSKHEVHNKEAPFLSWEEVVRVMALSDDKLVTQLEKDLKRVGWVNITEDMTQSSIANCADVHSCLPQM